MVQLEHLETQEEMAPLEALVHLEGLEHLVNSTISYNILAAVDSTLK